MVKIAKKGACILVNVSLTLNVGNAIIYAIVWEYAYMDIFDKKLLNISERGRKK